MKDRVRESLFNLLGPGVKGSHAIDLFAGTGALGLEAISRGAAKATLIERHLPTSRIIEQNAAALGVGNQIEVVFADAFIWARRWTETLDDAESTTAWTVFCSPPYDFYDNRRDDMLAMLSRLMESSPPGSLFAVEADERFNFAELPHAGQWELRNYLPAVMGIFHKA